MMKTANILTLLRIFISPIFILFFTINTFWSFIVCFILITINEASDFFDGKIARRYGQITDFGKLMDPFADSISRFTVFMCFLSANLAPIWMIAIFFYRDVLVSIVRVFSMKAGVVVAARQSGKTKAWVQAVCIYLVLIVLLLQKKVLLPAAFVERYLVLTTTLIISIAAAITLWSAIDYWLPNKAAVLSAIKIRENQKVDLHKQSEDGKRGPAREIVSQ
jgi:CDP-diacylglycerol--glycerol-3-phosphate 3-phosphatidyltransferase